MGSFIAQQPNGLYCRFSTVVDCPTHYNMTKDEYLNNCTGTVASKEDGLEILNKYLCPFSDVLERFVPNNMTQFEFNELVKTMSS
jgi:hypothetical protein